MREENMNKSSESCEEIKLSPNLAISAVIKISSLCYVAVTFRDFFSFRTFVQILSAH